VLGEYLRLFRDAKQQRVWFGSCSYPYVVFCKPYFSTIWLELSLKLLAGSKGVPEHANGIEDVAPLGLRFRARIDSILGVSSDV